MNYGQKILFDFMCLSISGRKQSDLTLFELEALQEVVEDLTHPGYYNDDDESCPDYLIMVNPRNAFEIFCEFWEENQNYIENYLVESEN